jgi:hypothetical protein
VPFLKDFVQEFSSRVNFLTVYIEEAHAANEWPIGSRLKYDQPKKMEDRFKIIEDFRQALDYYDVPVVADLVGEQGFTDNHFLVEYAPWPIRIYVIHQRTMRYIAEPKFATFGLAEVRDCLEQIFNDSK